jgi:hypothetical protein
LIQEWKNLLLFYDEGDTGLVAVSIDKISSIPTGKSINDYPCKKGVVEEEETNRVKQQRIKSAGPTAAPSTVAPSANPTAAPSSDPSTALSSSPTASPSSGPTAAPSADLTETPSSDPTVAPSSEPTSSPTSTPSFRSSVENVSD